MAVRRLRISGAISFRSFALGCPAPDYVGMGQFRARSPTAAYRFVDHRRYLDAWFEALGLTSEERSALVVHDWGSPLGLFDWARASTPSVRRRLAYMECDRSGPLPLLGDECARRPRAHSSRASATDPPAKILIPAAEPLLSSTFLPLRGPQEAVEVYRRLSQSRCLGSPCWPGRGNCRSPVSPRMSRGSSTFTHAGSAPAPFRSCSSMPHPAGFLIGAQREFAAALGPINSRSRSRFALPDGRDHRRSRRRHVTVHRQAAGRQVA